MFFNDLTVKENGFVEIDTLVRYKTQFTNDLFKNKDWTPTKNTSDYNSTSTTLQRKLKKEDIGNILSTSKEEKNTLVVIETLGNFNIGIFLIDEFYYLIDPHSHIIESMTKYTRIYKFSEFGLFHTLNYYFTNVKKDEIVARISTVKVYPKEDDKKEDDDKIMSIDKEDEIDSKISDKFEVMNQDEEEIGEVITLEPEEKSNYVPNKVGIESKMEGKGKPKVKKPNNKKTKKMIKVQEDIETDEEI